MIPEAQEFMAALCPHLPENERMIICAFPGDPAQATPSHWRPRPWSPGMELEHFTDWNGYVTVSSFFAADDGSWRRRSHLFAAGRVMMVDDVGTKVDPALVAGLPPSCKVETSPSNFQYWYFLDPAERDAARFDGVIRAFISGKMLGADPGMAGVTRVGRLPGYSNCKEKYGGWLVRLRELADRTYSVQDLLDGFGLQIVGRQVPLRKLPTDEALDRNRQFMVIYKFLQQRRMLKRDEPDPSGWLECTCPWVDNHTDGVDNGFAIREPDLENHYWGAAVCHHGSCHGKGWADLLEWVNEIAREELDIANGDASEFLLHMENNCCRDDRNKNKSGDKR